MQEQPFIVGQSVRVKNNVFDSEFVNVPLAGYQGRVIAIASPTSEMPFFDVEVAWDSFTLKSLPSHYVMQLLQADYSYETASFPHIELEEATARDTPKDVNQTLDALFSRYYWGHMGEAGMRIGEVLADIDPDDEDRAFECWLTHCKANMPLPFAAKVSVGLEDNQPQRGDIVTVVAWKGIDELEGIVVVAKWNNRSYDLFLSYLEGEALTEGAANVLSDYHLWLNETGAW